MDINEKIHFFLSNLRYKRFSFIPTIVIHGNYVMRLYAIYARFSKSHQSGIFDNTSTVGLLNWL